MADNLAAVGNGAIGDAFDSSSGLMSTSSPLYSIVHAALGCAESAASGTGCAGGAIGAATSTVVNSLVDSDGSVPGSLETAISAIAGGLAAGLAGANVQGATAAAENETENNWLNHIQWNPFGKTEAQQLADDEQGCSPSNQQDCDDATALLNLSHQRDAALASACTGDFSFGCGYQEAIANLGGNDVYSGGATTYATPATMPVQTTPSVGAATLDNMLSNPFSGILGGITYGLGGSNTDAYYASQLGVSINGVATSLSGYSIPVAPSLRTPNTINVLGVSPSSQATAWQGTAPYTGIDSYVDVNLPQGLYVVGAAPGQSNYYTTIEEFNNSGSTAEAYYSMLQIEPNTTNSNYSLYRDGVTVYRVNQISPAAFSSATTANPQFGIGGASQFFIPNFEDVLTPIYSIPFKKE